MTYRNDHLLWKYTQQRLEEQQCEAKNERLAREALRGHILQRRAVAATALAAGLAGALVLVRLLPF